MILAGLAAVLAGGRQLRAQAAWEFDGDLVSTTGQADLEGVGYPGVAGAPGITFATTEIGGETAQVAELSQGTALVVRHGAAANGGGSYVNQYTLVLDVLLPAVGDWISLYQTAAAFDDGGGVFDLASANDGDWFVDPAGGIGIAGNYGGTLAANTWYRLALVVDSPAFSFTSYVDGAQVQQNTGAADIDGRFTLYGPSDPDPYDWFLLFADETGGAAEMGAVTINSFCFFDRALSAGEIAALGGATAGGIHFVPAAENDACADATLVGVPSVSLGTTGGTAPDNFGGCGANDSPAAWYAVTGTGRDITVETCGSGFDTRLAVFTGTCDALACAGENDDSCGGQSRVHWSSAAGTTYLVRVFGFGADDEGDFTLTVYDSPVPANDLCADAQPIDLGAANPAVVAGTTRGALPDTDAPSCGDIRAPGVWYVVDGTGGAMTASTCSTAPFDSRISIFSGSCGDLSCIAENDDADGCANNSSFVEWDSAFGETYYILVHGFDALPGRYHLGDFSLAVTGDARPCIEITLCRPNQAAKTVALAWDTIADGHTGIEIARNGAVIATLPPEAISYEDAPALDAGLLAALDYEVRAVGLAFDCAATCGAVLSTGQVSFADDFDDYADDVALELAGYFKVEENNPIEDADWTVENPGRRNNPPAFDGRPTSGGFVISDSDAAGGADTTGSGMSHDLWTPSFSAAGKSALWLHVDVSAQLNNNGVVAFDIDVSTNDGATWTNVFRRVAPLRTTAAPVVDNDNSDGYFGRLDVDLSSVAGAASVKLRFRQFEPNDDWWVAIDNVIVDDVAPLTGGSSVLFTEGFTSGLGAMTAVSAAGNTCTETWHTTDKGGRYNPGAVTEHGANRLSRLLGLDTATFEACLNGAQEAPEPIPTAATGTGSFLYDFASGQLTFSIEYSGLSTAETGAHIHAGAPGVPGDVVVPLPAGNPKNGSVTLDAAQEALLVAGELYVNIHSDMYMSGEIRGQILAVAGFAILDSDADPDPAEDEWLVTPSLDCSGMREVFLAYESETVVGGTVQEVLVSLDGGLSYEPDPIFSYTTGALVDPGEEPFYAQRVFPVPAAAGAAEVVFAFHWVGQDDWWWAIDNVVVSGDPSTPPGPLFIRGDCDNDGFVGGSVNDIIVYTNWAFLGAPLPACLAACDADGNGFVGGSVNDVVYYANWAFLGGPPPRSPFPDCGLGDAADAANGCADPVCE